MDMPCCEDFDSGRRGCTNYEQCYSTTGGYTGLGSAQCVCGLRTRDWGLALHGTATQRALVETRATQRNDGLANAAGVLNGGMDWRLINSIHGRRRR